MCNVGPDGKLSESELHEAAALARLASLCFATSLIGSTSRLHETDWNCFAVILRAHNCSGVFAVADMNLPEAA